MRRIDGDLVFRFVAVGKAQVIVFEVDVKVGQYQSVLDVLPYNPRHFVAVQLNDGVFDLDLLSTARGTA